MDAPSAPGTRQLLAAAAAAAARAAPEAVLQVLREAMQLAGQGDRASALLALQLVNALAEEATRPAISAAVREALTVRCVDVLGLVRSVLSSGDATSASDGLGCLKQWAETLGVEMGAVLATEGLLWALCQLMASDDEYVIDSLADCFEVLLPRPFASGKPPSEEPWRTDAVALGQLAVAAIGQGTARLGDEQPMLVRRGICRLMATIAAVQPALAANSQLKRLLMLGECTDPTLLPLLGCLVMCVMYAVCGMCVMYAVFRYSEVLYCLGVPRYGPI